jgi:hypothetical protein
MASETNNYCTRLSVPVPRLEDFVGRRDIKLFDLLVVALLEHGAPLPIELLAGHLVAAGAESETGDMAYSLQKAWHGMQPVFRDAEGRLGLDFSSPELNRRLRRLGLKGGGKERNLADLEPAPAPIPDDTPLTEDEVRWAFGQRSLFGYSALRQVAAVLDSVGKPMAVADLDAYLSRLTSHRSTFQEETIASWRKAYVHRDVEGALWLDRTAPEVPAMRRAIRELGAGSRERELRAERWKRDSEERQVDLAQERAQTRQAAAGLRRAVVRVVPDKGPVAAAALLDIGSRVIRTFVGEELAELPGELEPFNVVAATWVRESLHALGVTDVDRFRLVDMKPPRKTRQLNRQGRKLAITPELLITSTTGISHPLGDPAKIAAYLASGDVAKLRRRLESDVKALFAFYQYGVLHGCLRLRWGFLDETMPVEWAVPGDPSLYETLETFRAARQIVEIVWGSAPGWTDPWSRARRVTIAALEFWTVVVEADGQRWEIPRHEIQAVRAALDTSEGGETGCHANRES